MSDHVRVLQELTGNASKETEPKAVGGQKTTIRDGGRDSSLSFGSNSRVKSSTKRPLKTLGEAKNKKPDTGRGATWMRGKTEESKRKTATRGESKERKKI